MHKKRHIIITAVVTFYVATLFYLIVGARFLLPGFFGNNDGFDSKLARVESLMDKYFIFDYDKQELHEGALEGYLAAADDPYTEYISKAEFPAYTSSIEGEYKGIGVTVELFEGNFMKVSAVTDDGPAAKAGIRTGDILKSVNGFNINFSTYNEALAIIRGTDKRGSDDNLEIVVSRNGEEIEIGVLREVITTVYVNSRMIDGNIGYIRLTSFEGKAAEQFHLAVDSLLSDGAKGFVFDIRSNPGGSLDVVLSITDRVLKEGKIITIKSKDGSEAVYSAEDDKSIDIPVCVLVNGGSASASEVFASALKDHKVATVIGEQTFGKGIVQSIYELGDGSAVKLTTAEYYTPNGVSIHEVGVLPDIIVSLDDDVSTMSIAEIPFEKDAQLKRAIEEIKK